MSVVDPLNYLDYNFTLQPTSARFAVSAWNFMGIVGLHASLGLLLEVGIERIATRVLSLTGLAIADLQSRGFNVVSSLDQQHRSGIVVVEVPNPQVTYEKLLAAGVITSPRGKGIRLSPHFYNTEDEVCRVGEMLSEEEMA
jgi:selenocysteine lyase/cysteine desulfurase